MLSQLYTPGVSPTRAVAQACHTLLTQGAGVCWGSSALFVGGEGPVAFLALSLPVLHHGNAGLIEQVRVHSASPLSYRELVQFLFLNVGRLTSEPVWTWYFCGGYQLLIQDL